MYRPPNVNTYHVNGQIADKAAQSRSAESSTDASVSVLNNANHTRINNSSFSITSNTINFNAFHVFCTFLVFFSLVYFPPWHARCWRSAHTIGDVASKTFHGLPPVAPLDLLYKSVAPNAILNAGGRADEVRCHPGTREEVIHLIEKFVDMQQDEGSPRMLWLSGPAGAGKTAIMQTVAERCTKRGVPHASFFFFRTDSSRNQATALVATLMHQIVQLYPSIANAIAAALASNPLIFQMGLQQQFDTFIHIPFAAIQHSSPARRPIVLLIDGLDECDSERMIAQEQILQALDTLLAREGVSFRVAVASRVEPHIAMAFKQLNSQINSIFLDEQYFPERDIRLLVTAEFNKVKATHYLAHTLDKDWPSTSDVDNIVMKSSGQFIYAATVMRFLTYSSSSPVLSLQRVRGIVPSGKISPFAHLDAVYTYILHQVDDQFGVKSILACALVAGHPEVPTVKTCLKAFHPRYSEEMFDSCIADLTSIVQIRYGQMRHDQILRHGVLEFFHASFTDFLQDKSRAGFFYIDVSEFSAVILPKIWTAVSFDDIDIMIFARLALLEIRWPTPEITALFMNPELSGSDSIELGAKAVEYLVLINKHYDLYCLYCLPIGIESIWKAAVGYLVRMNTVFDYNEGRRNVENWKSEMEELEMLLPENLRLELSR